MGGHEGCARCFSFVKNVPTFGLHVPTPSPFIPTRALTLPTGERWVHEVKFDGYRLLAHRVGERVVLRTRGGFDWSGRYPRIVRSVLDLSVSSVTMDGEVAILTEDGVSDFDALHSRTNDGWAILLAFDLLEIEGEDLRDQPLAGAQATAEAALEPTR